MPILPLHTGKQNNIHCDNIMFANYTLLFPTFFLYSTLKQIFYHAILKLPTIFTTESFYRHHLTNHCFDHE